MTRQKTPASPRRSPRLLDKAENRCDLQCFPTSHKTLGRNRSQKKHAVLPFPLEEQETPLVSEQTLIVLIDDEVINQVEKAIRGAQGVQLLEYQDNKVPQTLLHDTVPPRFMNGPVEELL